MVSANVMADAKANNEANEIPEGLQPALARLQKLMKGAWPKLVRTASFVIKEERNYPKNSEMLSDLAKIEDTAKLLIEKLVDLQIQGLLSNGDDTWTNGLNPTWHGLHEIAERVRTLIPRKQGDSRYYPASANGPNAMQTCALMVAIAHYKECGKWLNGKNEREECEALWKHAGGGLRRSGADSFGVWRTHLGRARNYYTHDVGKHILNDILTTRATNHRKRRLLQLQYSSSREMNGKSED
jgi:hypothetical protein